MCLKLITMPKAYVQEHSQWCCLSQYGMLSVAEPGGVDGVVVPGLLTLPIADLLVMLCRGKAGVKVLASRQSINFSARQMEPPVNETQ